VIEFTGERVVPGQVDPDLWAEHLSRYALATRWARGSQILDIGCGAGYGTAELASQATRAVGVDLSPEATEHARRAYPSSNVHFVPASATALPFADATFTLITAFEVIEHLDDWRALLAEARRVLHPDGVFLVSTPNKRYYTESRGTSGPNPFHTHEFEYTEFQKALADFFPYTTLLLQNHLETFAFYREAGETAVEGRMDGVSGSADDAHFFLGVCSLKSTPAPGGFLFVHRGSNVLRDREKHIRSLEDELLEARAQYAALHQAHNELTAHLEEQNQWALRTVTELDATRERLGLMQEELESRTRWALDLNARVQALEAERDMIRSSRWIRLGRSLNVGPDLEAPSPEASPQKANETGGGV